MKGMLKVLRTGGLKKTFGFHRYEVTGAWRKLRIEELHDVYSPSVIRAIKSRRMWWVGHSARTGE
jgi:hypothetical protein